MLKLFCFGKKEAYSDQAKKDAVRGEGNKVRNQKEGEIEAISKRNGWDPDFTERYLGKLKQNYNILPREIAKLDLNQLSETALVVRVQNNRRKKRRLDDIYSIIEKETGKDKRTIREEIKKYRAQDENNCIRLQSYFRYDGYMVNVDNPEAAKAWVSDIYSLQCDIKSIKDRLDECGPLADIICEIEELRERIDNNISRGRRRQNFAFVSLVRSDIVEGSEEYRKITTDIELTECLLGFLGDEYAIFHFWEKPLIERLKYVSGEKRRKILKILNEQKGIDLLNNKYEAYCMLKDLYGREIVLFDADKTFEEFEEFCLRHPIFVKKNNFDSLGRGVEKVNATDSCDLRKIYKDLTIGGKCILLEELIIADPCISMLNPDSVNTIRVITYRTGNSISVEDAFLKVGRKGAFIDNGGAGGILVHVDPEFGIIDSVGIEETGVTYDRHPDNGHVFLGYTFPEWEKALTLVKRAALRLDSIRYIGWDITYQAGTGWIIVEGNANTQFLGQQGTVEKGLFSRLLLATQTYKNTKSEAKMLAIRSGMKENNWSIDIAEEDVLLAATKYGITYKEYYINKFYICNKMPRKALADRILEQRQLRDSSAAEKRSREDSREEECLREVICITGWDKETAKRNMDNARLKTGAIYHDYSRFHFWDLTEEEQKQYFTYDKANALKKKYNTGHLREKLIATNKDLFCEEFKNYLTRRWSSTANLSLDDFIATFNNEERLVYKPRGGTGGYGIRIFDIVDKSKKIKDEGISIADYTYGYNLEEVYSILQELPFGVIEAFIHQHPEMSKYSGASVNTIRVVTIRTNDVAQGIETDVTHFIYSAMRMGAEGSFTDNLHAGGMVAAVDVMTGEVVTDAADYSGKVYKVHPYTGEKIQGFVIPFYSEIVELIDKVSRNLNLEGYLGWDVAITENGPEIVELNINPGQGILQIPYVEKRRGMAHVFKNYI